MTSIYQNMGLKVGLEIHQQLDTKHKLFCGCPTNLSEMADVKFVRILRPTQSELGLVDQAALFEFKKGRSIEYEAANETSCLVEMDEEPPHRLNDEAIDIALTVSILLGSKPVDEIHVMRKLVIDGSNTTGFQRTCVISLGGSVGMEHKVEIQHVSIEEDAARKIEESDRTSKYRIDRLGIPLIEVATAPTISTPQEAQEVALQIGRLLRATRRVKRGLGTIRQDLNISTKNGGLVEIKGVQRLDMIAEIVESEVTRQISLLEVKRMLEERCLNVEDLKEEFHDVTQIFSGTKSKLISKAVSSGGVVLALRLPKFRGLLGKEIQKGVRLGSELAQRAIFWGGVGGIFHTDELPNYGISEVEVAKLMVELELSEMDAAVIVADSPANAREALRAVVERAKECLLGVPEETRAANDDGTTRYMRPRPGSARMYPETDIPPVVITEDRLLRLKSALPPMPDDLVNQLIHRHKINRKLAEQLVDSDYLELFEEVTAETNVAPSFAATVLTEVFKSLSRDGVPVGNLSGETIFEVFKAVDLGFTAKEAIPEILRWLTENPGCKVEVAIEKLGLKTMSNDELKSRICSLLDRNIELIESEGVAATGKLMNMIMAEVRGRVDAKKVIEFLKEEVAKRSGMRA
ncbi:MAG: Glu-tRNA(Gln) amidotransferase subunit GatE [Candidatus Bathyarchaeia archaeon]